jgi:phenylacetate-CoA ligase
MTDAREVLLGPSYFYHRHIIEQSKTWTVGQIEDYQAIRVSRLHKCYGTGLTQKDDYQRSLRHYTRWNIAPLTRTVRTGGTSGQPLRFKADTFARRQKERAYLFDIWSRVGYRPHDLRLVYRGNVRRKLLHFDYLENAWILSPSATTEDQIGSLRRWLLRLPPFFLHVYPSSLYTFVDIVGERVFRQLPIRGVLAGSENFAPGERLRFESEFDIQVSHWYGHSEYAVLAFNCRECDGFHFYPTYGYVELVPTELDRMQRIVATSFNRIGTQFCRYDTGDLAIPAPPVSCVDQFPRVSAIAGRVQESFLDGAGRRRGLGPYLFGIHGAFWDDVRDLQFVQDRAGHLQVRLVTTSRADRRRLESILEKRLTMVKLDFDYVSEIERNANGKRRYFVDASQADLVTQPARAEIQQST